MSVHKNTGREQDSGKGCATIENNYCLKKWNFFFKKWRKNLMQTCFKTWCPRGKCSGRRCESFQTVKTSLSLTISEIMIMCAAVGWIFTIQTSAASGSPGSICCLNTAATLHTPHHITIYNSTQWKPNETEHSYILEKKQTFSLKSSGTILTWSFIYMHAQCSQF